jgi:hypothetical protein
MTRTIFACCALSLVVYLNLTAPRGSSGGDEKGEIDFQILTDKTTYLPGSTMHVKFIVTNTNVEPLYLHRDLDVCGGQLGFVFFQILDQNNRDVRTYGCAVDIWPPGEEVEHLADPTEWILLKQGNICGGAADFELPAKKGIYRVDARLIPTGFTDKQKQTLSQKHMRVLTSAFSAPVVSITVK